MQGAVMRWDMTDVKPCFMCANLNMRLDYEHAQFIFLIHYMSYVISSDW